jgi:hypothetical protein
MESTEDAERLFIEDFDTWDMTGYYLYSKLLGSGVSRHIGTGGCGVAESANHDLAHKRGTMVRDYQERGICVPPRGCI